MLSSFSQIEKDMILYVNIHIKEEVEEDSLYPLGRKYKCTKTIERDRTVEEIEKLPYIKTMLDSGANVLFQYHSNMYGWDEEALDFSDGEKILIDTSIYDKYNFVNTINPILKNWTMFSFEQYLELINHNETERLNDIVNLRNSNPLKYYNRLIERSYK